MPKPQGKVKTFQSEWTLGYGLEVSTSNPSTSESTSVLCFLVISLAKKMKMLNVSVNWPQISNTSANHGEVTILTLTWGSNIQRNGMCTHTCHQKTSHIFCKEWICWRCQHVIFCQLEGSMKASIIAFVQPEGSMKACITTSRQAVLSSVLWEMKKPLHSQMQLWMTHYMDVSYKTIC